MTEEKIASRRKSEATKVRLFLQHEGGQSLIEYALIACMIGLGAAIAMTSLRTSISSVFNKLGNVLSNAL